MGRAMPSAESLWISSLYIGITPLLGHLVVVVSFDGLTIADFDQMYTKTYTFDQIDRSRPSVYRSRQQNGWPHTWDRPKGVRKRRLMP